MIRKNTKGLYDTIKADILMGYFEPGHKLKIEELKARYQAGVNVVRESLTRLAAEDLVDAEDQKGFRVAEMSLSRLGELTRLRILLEQDGLKSSINNGGVEWETRLVAVYHKLAYIEEKMCNDEKKHCEIWYQCDREFHETLLSACNSQLHRIYHKRIFDQFRQYVMVDLRTHGFRGKELVTEHKAIVDAALARDVERCNSALELHLGHYHRSHMSY